MKSAIAILTYNRIATLKNCLESVRKHAPGYPIAVFEDFGNKDNTRGYLGVNPVAVSRDLEAVKCVLAPNEEAYLGESNLGVAGNSNRALAWFWNMGYDHVVLCNDDIVASGDFVKEYAEAHKKTSIGLFCYCGFTSDQYRWAVRPHAGLNLKILSRLTGMMMSITRNVVGTIGFFDPRFGFFGEEHCDYTHRAQLAGFQNIDGKPQHGIDIEQNSLAYQDATSSVPATLRPEFDAIAAAQMAKSSQEYRIRGLFRPYALRHAAHAGGDFKNGIKTEFMSVYATVYGDKIKAD